MRIRDVRLVHVAVVLLGIVVAWFAIAYRPWGPRPAPVTVAYDFGCPPGYVPLSEPETRCKTCVRTEFVLPTCPTPMILPASVARRSD